MAIFDGVIVLLREFGFFHVLLPFLLVFAMIYGMLSKTKIFGEDEKAMTINAIIGFSIGFYVIAYTPVVEAIAELVPQAAFLLVVLMLLLVASSFFMGGDLDLGASNAVKGIIIVVLALIFLGIVDASTSFQIPIIHQISLMLTGEQIAQGISQETTNMIVAGLLIIAMPIAVIMLVAMSSK